MMMIKFTDQNGIECSLQDSSIATEDCIWLGCNSADPKTLIPGDGWKPVSMPKNYIANTRMHLTKEQVLFLLPQLQHFVETGFLDSELDPTEYQPMSKERMKELIKTNFGDAQGFMEKFNDLLYGSEMESPKESK